MRWTSPSLLLLMLVLPACGEEDKAPAATGDSAIRDAVKQIKTDPKKWAEENPADADTLRDVKDGKLSPGEALDEYLARTGDGTESGGGAFWDGLSMPSWIYLIPFGIAALILLACMVDLPPRLWRRRQRRSAKPRVPYKHFVSRLRDPPPDPPSPPGPPTDPTLLPRPPVGHADLPETSADSAEPPESQENLHAA